MRRSVLACVIVVLMLGCSLETGRADNEKKVDENPVNIISADEAVGELPCFKCHSYQKFSALPKQGIFAHQLHMDKGYHCNQCHDVIGHKHFTINKDICNNCHLLDVMTFNSTVLPAMFDHKTHSSQYKCNKCHPEIFLMSRGSVRLTMKDIDNGKYCGACHYGKEAFPSSECTKCHEMKGFNKKLTYIVDSIGNATFSHVFHTEAFSCDNCHPGLFGMKKTEGNMTMDDMNRGKFCGSCHDGDTASSVNDCEKCHQAT